MQHNAARTPTSEQNEKITKKKEHRDNISKKENGKCSVTQENKNSTVGINSTGQDRIEFSMSLRWCVTKKKNVPGNWLARRACAASVENIRTSCSIEVAGGKSETSGAACRGGPIS